MIPAPGTHRSTITPTDSQVSGGLQLVYPQARLLAPKIRAFIDFAVPRVKERLGEGAI